MENDILSEVKKPLTDRENFERTQRLWAMARTTPEADTYERNLMRMYEKALARIEALEAEREKIAEMRQEFLDDFSGGIICKRVREEGVYTVGNYSFLGKAFDEEYDIISIIDRHFPSPPDRAQGVKG